MVNAVAPGFIETDMTRELNVEFKQTALNRTPLNSFGTPEDVAAVVKYLVSKNAAYVTGQVINVNGGLYM